MKNSSTTDLTPTLIGIYDALLEPAKSTKPESNRLETAKDARNDPPVQKVANKMTQEKDNGIKPPVCSSPPKNPSKLAGGVRLPIASINKSSLYDIRTKSDTNGASEITSEVFSDIESSKVQRTFREVKYETAFDNFSPNVKRMLSSASETTTLKFQKKPIGGVRSSSRKCNIPLVGTTSKISQSGVEILPSVEIYDQPQLFKSISKVEEPVKPQIKPEFKTDEAQTYDVPTNNRPAIYDVPNPNKTSFDSLSLPYIDQSIELSIANDREFDTKLSSQDNSPSKPEKTSTPDVSPTKIMKTGSLQRNSNETKHLIKATFQVGSTGSLKPPEKERLNPPIEVTRPLSMSSIASSSSTSSSGVQNKGGVNSAYLASIESLDDHSDADLTSANGSNNFVNIAGKTASLSEDSRVLNVPRQIVVEEMSGMSQLERVCAEIVQTENVYVEDLRQVVEGYLHVWRREVTFSDEELSELFNNIEDIYIFNRSLCSELNTCRLDATCIARCFVNNTAGFSVYTSYCTGYPGTMERLAALASKPQSAREFRERQLGLNHPLPLASYLLKPVQRILKYHLLLQNVVKQCASSETEYALQQMTAIAQHIDDMKRRHEHAVRVQEIQSLLYGWNGPDLTTYGELCAEGTFRVFGAKAMRHAFLFDKMLLVTKNREDGILAYKSHIMCNNMMLVESIAGAPLSFHVIPWDAPRAQLTLQARSPRHKREWTLLLKRVILENYNAVIPSHARQLVMELGQNKTDDDILAEKSHNLITQASMRKQLSAPEYLEKRKLERERRKSFENGRTKKLNRKLTPPNASDSQDCDCVHVSAEKGIDYTCDVCYVDLCSECEELAKEKDKCNCKIDDTDEKCPECDRFLHYIDAGSVEHLERKQLCKCGDFKSSQESFNKESSGLYKTRNFHSSDNIIGYTDMKSKEDLSDIPVAKMQKTCLKCSKIKENIVVTDSSGTLRTRKSRCTDSDRTKTDTLRSKSRDDPQRSKLSKIGTWRRKSEPGLQNAQNLISKKSQDSDGERYDGRNDKIEFECRNCGSNRIIKKQKSNEGTLTSDPENESRKMRPAVEIRMYNTKNIPKKISKIKKNRAKGRLGSNTTRFYTDFSTDVSTQNILHISESNDSLNEDKSTNVPFCPVSESISKDEDIDEETYKKLIEKTDSFKKNELEKVKYLNKQNVINEGSETQSQQNVQESCEESEQPLEQIISQLLLQNREFQKLLKKQQQRNSAHRRNQRLLKSHSIPDEVISTQNDFTKLRPKFTRQLSENIELSINEEKIESIPNNISDVHKDDISDDDHIYETLRVDKQEKECSRSTKNKPSEQISQTLKFIKDDQDPTSISICASGPPESDYVYLSFDEIKQVHETIDGGLYDVPVASPEKVEISHPKIENSTYYVAMKNQGPPVAKEDNLYDNLVDVIRRKKDVPTTLETDYLPMSPDLQSPNTPEIWLSRQKEHFNVSRDRKSGSLPRSFQVPTNITDDPNLGSFKCKPNGSKTYINRDGKVMSVDRPFTIASDQSEISYDDVEAYMSEGDILKFNKSSKTVDDSQNISKSTLELEEEIDRCYKNNFEKINLDQNKNEHVNVTLTNLDVSVTSSCEALTSAQHIDKTKISNAIHPEHKIYKPTGSALSLKNVLSRFKTRTPPKSDGFEPNANEIEDKTDPKSPTSDKRPGLNPRSYSKNLLQRFRSIIGDDHSDDNQNKVDVKTLKLTEANKINVINSSTDNIPTTSVYTVTTDMSRSVCERSESQVEKENLEILSQSCDNLSQKPQRLSYEKSVSMVTTTSSLSSTSSPSKSNCSSHQSLNKLPIYMQGSKHLGARIAQSDYVDPTKLMNERNEIKNINILINKNAIRPDSLFSNSSFVTLSSEGTYHETHNKVNVMEKSTESSSHMNSDESYYEKSFEKIEQVTDEDVFRDSAVYSDQEESEESKIEEKMKTKVLSRVESIKRNSSFKKHMVSTEKIDVRTAIRKTANTEKINDTRPMVSERKTKIAPPVPIKPKLSQLASVSTIQTKIITNKNLVKSIDQSSSSESINTRTIKRNTTSKSNFARSESAPETQNSQAKQKISTHSFKTTKPTDKVVEEKQNNIEIKRLGFERASLDSATRKRSVDKRCSIDQPKSKSVLERRMELEKMAKNEIKPVQSKKPIQPVKPKLLTTKVASFERSATIPKTIETKKTNIPVSKNNDESEDIERVEGSWVKQVVNKFQ
ncbi:uncharacterized protein LOC126976108 isoform X2 [Leptidea sinapis]|uniref:uncharacterized protein LOC126976108 isoform X2 n=1 Tax=Leptidea sinapis TaxID=189913 RepID=UPI0021C2B6B7|nr:uncharacterized protein LOC126976108 isoform X2 [Leptidea sinapis]